MSTFKKGAGGVRPEPEPDARGTLDLVGHTVILPNTIDTAALPRIDNIIVPAKSEEGRWIEESCLSVAEWRSTFQSIYIQWSLAVNGLYVAADRYQDPHWLSSNEFYVRALRGDGKTHTLQPIAVWPGDEAAKFHRATVAKVVAWALIELFAAFEQFVFHLYRTYLTANPDPLLQGADFRSLRKLRRDAAADEAKRSSWEAAWATRLDAWQRKKMYEGLHMTLLAYLNAAGLKKPSSFIHTEIDDWAESLRAIAIVRNCLVHGEGTVPKELAEIAHKPHAGTLRFNEGDPLRVEMLHLQGVELFANQLLTAINLSLTEHPSAGR